MKQIINNPRNQTNNEIVTQLLTNTKRQYTEASHAEIFSRLITTIQNFNAKAEKTEKAMLILAVAQVVLALTQIIFALR